MCGDTCHSQRRNGLKSGCGTREEFLNRFPLRECVTCKREFIDRTNRESRMHCTERCGKVFARRQKKMAWRSVRVKAQIEFAIQQLKEMADGDGEA
jgi:DNA-directed RNA polymerase subunit RPC12/RpoP